MRRAIALFAASSLIILAGCGGGADSPPRDTTSTSEQGYKTPPGTVDFGTTAADWRKLSARKQRKGAALCVTYLDSTQAGAQEMRLRLDRLLREGAATLGDACSAVEEADGKSAGIGPAADQACAAATRRFEQAARKASDTPAGQLAAAFVAIEDLEGEIFTLSLEAKTSEDRQFANRFSTQVADLGAGIARFSQGNVNALGTVQAEVAAMSDRLAAYSREVPTCQSLVDTIGSAASEIG